MFGGTTLEIVELCGTRMKDGSVHGSEAPSSSNVPRRHAKKINARIVLGSGFYTQSIPIRGHEDREHIGHSTYSTSHEL